MYSKLYSFVCVQLGVLHVILVYCAAVASQDNCLLISFAFALCMSDHSMWYNATSHLSKINHQYLFNPSRFCPVSIFDHGRGLWICVTSAMKQGSKGP